MFKDKIIAAFKLKYPGVNLSKTRLAAIATRIEAKIIDDESKIDGALAAMDDAYPFTEIAKDDDKIRTLEAKSNKTNPADPKKTEDPKPAADPVIDPDVPSWAQALLQSNKTLTEKLAAIEGEKTVTTLRKKAAEKLKDIPEVFWSKRALPENEEGLEAFVTEVTTDFGTFNQDRVNNGLAAVGAPKAAAGGDQKVKEATKEEVDSVVANIM